MNYLLHLLVYWAINIMVALSLNFLLGLCGLVSMAHASYFAVGAYTYALATTVLGWSLGPAWLLAVILASVLSLLVAVPAWKFRGDSFLLVSLAVQTLLHSVISNWVSPGATLGTWSNLTNGNLGIAGISRPTLLWTRIDSLPRLALLAAAVALITCLVSYGLLHSTWGRLLRAIRDDEIAALGLGKHARRAKVEAAVVGCSVAAVAGATYASYVGYVDPSVGSLDESISMLSMVLIGGAGNVGGPILGATVVLVLPEVLRFTPLPDNLAANARVLLYGAMLVAFMHWRPRGLAGEVDL